MSGIYTIPLIGLKEGSHIYDFDVDKDFFDDYEESGIGNSRLIVETVLIKRSAHMELEISIRGEVNIMCDRCLDDYWQTIESKNKMLVKLGEEWEEADDEVLTIPSNESRIDISKFIYEFVHLALPLQRFHPETEEGESTCNPAMLEKLEEHSTDSEENIDPRWKELGILKDGFKK